MVMLGLCVFDSLKIANKIKSLRYAGTINKEIVMNSDLNHKIDSFSFDFTKTAKIFKEQNSQKNPKCQILRKTN